MRSSLEEQKLELQKQQAVEMERTLEKVCKCKPASLGLNQDPSCMSFGQEVS